MTPEDDSEHDSDDISRRCRVRSYRTTRAAQVALRRVRSGAQVALRLGGGEQMAPPKVFGSVCVYYCRTFYKVGPVRNPVL